MSWRIIAANRRHGARRPGSQWESGSRQARVALRQAPLEDDVKPVWPGMVGGRYRPLTDEQVLDVHNAAFTLLEEVGMGQPIPEFIELTTANGGTYDAETHRIHLPREMVEAAIDSAAKELVMPGFDPKHDLEVGGERVFFGTGGAAVLMFDVDQRSYRESTLLDLYDLARLADTLEHVHFYVRQIVARDMVEPRDLDLNTAYAIANGTTKHVVTSHFGRSHVAETARMGDLMLGGDDEFRRRPFIGANNTFVVPPLRFAEESCECLVEQVRGPSVIAIPEEHLTKLGAERAEAGDAPPER